MTGGKVWRILVLLYTITHPGESISNNKEKKLNVSAFHCLHTIVW